MVKEESSEERFGDNIEKPMDPNHASMLKSVTQVEARNQQLPGSAVDIKIEINPVLTPRTALVKLEKLIGIPGSVNNIHQQDGLRGVACITMDGSMSNSFRRNEQSGRKRKQPLSSSGPANSSGTANTVGPSPSSAPSTHTPGDAISMTSLLRSCRCMDVSKGFTFSEVNSVRASTGKVISCDLSSDGKLLASAGHDKKAVLWHTYTMKPKTILEGHTALITDVRFSPNLPRLATSSFDKTVRVWDIANEGSCLRTFMGHSSMVTSLDFHPNKDDLICSCEKDGEIRYWSINNGSCTRVYKSSSTQKSFQPRVRKYDAASVAVVRFQPRVGKYLAASSENVVSVLDVETQAYRHSLQGHSTPINSVCWDPSGDFLASVSNDMVKVWTLGTGSEGECIHELRSNTAGRIFSSCVFHPDYPALLVIGCYQSIELWNMVENKVMALPAHECLIASLAVSTATGLVASASHDKQVKLWK